MLESLVHVTKGYQTGRYDNMLLPDMSDLEQSVGYHLTMLELLVCVIKTDQADRYQNMLLHTIPDL